jgi:hypothetical protein
VRAEVTEIIGRGPETPVGHIPFTPRAKKVMELSLREARQLGHNYIGTEHILLGLIREGEGLAAQVLQKLGVELHSVRQIVIRLLSGSSDEATEGERRHIEAPMAEHWPTEGLIIHGQPHRLPGFVGVVNGRGSPLGIVGVLSAVFVLVTIVAVLADRPLNNLAGSGLITLFCAVAVSTVGAAAHLLPSAPEHRSEQFVRWAAVVALVLFATGAILIGLDPLLR